MGQRGVVGLMDAPAETTMTRPHRQLIQLLEGLGLTVETEVGFPPKFVDCYLPDLHVAVEADGPAHSRERDLDRDAYLMARYALPVYRVSATALREGPRKALSVLLMQVLGRVWRPSVIERRAVSRVGGEV